MDQSRVESLIAAARPSVFWSDRNDGPRPAPALTGTVRADLAVIGAGFTGLWAALQAAEESPGRSVVVLEANVAGYGASSRNGGFCEASLTHGLANGLGHWPDEMATLLRMGHENLADLVAACHRLGIDAEIQPTGQLSVAVAPWQVDELHDMHREALEWGESSEWLDADQVRAQVSSPTYMAGVWDRAGAVMVNPARLVWGLRNACEAAGVKFYDHSRVTHIDPGRELWVHAETGTVIASRVIMATNAWAEPESSVRKWILPIWDHVLMTEPLTADQMDSIGWSKRQGLADSGSQFHYYRLTADDRILWGGWDANYHRNNGMGPECEAHTATHTLLARHFFATFPQLSEVGFSHRWAGPIATTSKFTASFGTRHDDRLVWAGGYTGLGVGASRWAARVALDLVDCRATERTELAMVTRKPFPFPPEPLRWPVVQFTRRAIVKSDRNGGRPGPWLRLLDAAGIGFDS